MWRRTPPTGARQSTGGRPATPAMRSVGGSASASRRYSAGPRVPPACARPVTAASPASAGCSPSLPLPTTWFGCPSWWGPRRSHARNLPGPGKNRQNQHKSLLKTRFSATTARVSNKNSTKRVASTASFRILLGLVGDERWCTTADLVPNSDLVGRLAHEAEADSDTDRRYHYRVDQRNERNPGALRQ